MAPETETDTRGGAHPVLVPLLRLAGLVLSVLPPALATLSCFPLWRERGGGALLSGFTLLLLLFSILPLWRYLKAALASPAAWMLWGVLFLLFFFLSKIADEMAMIALVGFLSNLAGALAFRIAGRLGRRESDRPGGSNE